VLLSTTDFVRFFDLLVHSTAAAAAAAAAMEPCVLSTQKIMTAKSSLLLHSNTDLPTPLIQQH